MKNIVLLTSAVYTNYGIYNPVERIQQTLDTAKSAKKYIPGAVVILVDNSKTDVQNDTSPEFEELIDLVDYYIDNSDDADIKYFHDNVQNYDIGKNAMEAVGIMKALTYISNDADMMEEVKDADPSRHRGKHITTNTPMVIYSRLIKRYDTDVQYYYRYNDRIIQSKQIYR